MEDRILIKRIETDCVIGVYAWERKKRQPVAVDLEISCDAAKAARRDDVRDAVDYKKISDAAVEYVRASRFKLIESLAEGIASKILTSFRVPQVMVRVWKPGALPSAENVGIEITRRRAAK